MFHWQWTHHLKNYETHERDVHCVVEKKKRRRRRRRREEEEKRRREEKKREVSVTD